MNLRYATILSACLLSLSACKSEDEKDKGPSTLVGRWQLSELQCHCIPKPTIPNEAVEFDRNGTATFYVNGQVESRGTYQFANGKFCGSTSDMPVLRISNLPGIYDDNIAYTLEPSKLVLDQGACTDAPRKTYERQQP